MDTATLLQGLTERQAHAVTTTGAPVCILAGAGSGKTRVLTRRIAYRAITGDAEPRHVLALTFTRRAAAELGRRLGDLGVRDRVTAGTFHALAYAQLRGWWADNGRRPPALLERKAGLLARLLGSGGAKVQPADLAGEIEWAKARMVDPAHYAHQASSSGRRPPLALEEMASLYSRYEQDKARRGLIDFDDLLLHCVTALTTDGDFAASQRWRYRHLFVDEFQDVNPVQARLLAGWRGDSDDLCVVGDPNQAIYSWNGADPDQLRTFAQREPGATLISLDDNFRSTPSILAVAGAVIGSGPAGVPALQPHRPEGSLPSVRAYDTDADEARGIARAVRDRHRPGGPWSHVAVLTRTNAQLVALEQAFLAAGIPIRVRGGRAFLERPEVKGALAELAASSASLAMGLADVAGAARRCGVEPAPVGADAGPAASPGHGEPADERQASLEELVRLGHDYLAHEADASVGGFVAWLSASLRSEASRGASDAVELATFHAAKGLEWPVVFLAGLEHGLVPISHAATNEARDEERRLLYVAVTRAEDELHCSWARSRAFGTRSLRRQPSPWLEEIEAARATLAAGQAQPGTSQWKARFAAERSRLRGTDGDRGRPTRRAGVQVGRHADPELLATLERWRSGAARAGGVPAFVVLHDTTLAALAEAQPLTADSLLAVPGLGPLKASRYGSALLEVVADHQRQREPLTGSPIGARKDT